MIAKFATTALLSSLILHNRATSPARCTGPGSAQDRQTHSWTVFGPKILPQDSNTLAGKLRSVRFEQLRIERMAEERVPTVDGLGGLET